LRIKLPNGEGRLVPVEWTDQKPEIIVKEGARFELEKLIEIQKRIEGMRDKAVKAGTITPLEEQDKGEEDGEAERKASVRDNRGAARASDSDLGANGSASVGADREG
jgi:hypothetical protein